ncbi:MAG: hypothetical protein ACI9C4_000429 [Paraglaciecola sp.]|jgi:uncharacterized protein YjbI with pentapeptide repeats
MRLIKPKKLGYLQRTYSIANEHYFVASPLLFFNLCSGEVLAENTQWKKVAEILGAEPLDQAMPKTKAEILLMGKAYPTIDQDVCQMQVSIKVAEFEKSLRVTGKRQWEKDIWQRIKPGQPKSLSTVELTYENSFGGKNFARNPQGVGLPESGQRYQDCAIPQIDSLNQPICRFKRAVEPAGFAPYPIIWPQRAQYHGNYKGEWLKKYFPAMAPDTDMRLFNSAPADQQLGNYLRGDETFCLQGLHPEYPVLEGRLPGIRIRSFVHNQGKFSEISLQIDTLWLLPEQNLGVLIYRGQLAVTDSDAEQLSDTLLAYEKQTEQPRDIDYYQRAFVLKTDPESAAAHAMNEALLSPSRTTQEEQVREQKLEQQQKEKVLTIKAQTQALLADTPLLEKPVSEPKLSAFDNILQEDIDNGDIDLTLVLGDSAKAHEQAQQKLQVELSKADAARKAIPESTAPSEHQLVAQAIKAATSNQQLTQLQSVDNPLTAQHQIEFGRMQQQAKQMAVVTQQISTAPVGVGIALRQLLMARIAEQLPLTDLDLSSANLSNLHFSHLDFSYSVLSNADLSSCVFEQCRFEHSALVKANVETCIFSRCQFVQANISGLQGQHCHFEQCELSQMQLIQLNLGNLYMQACQLLQLQVIESNLPRARFIDCQLKQSTFSHCQLTDSDFTGAQIKQNTFIEVNFDYALWANSSIEQSVWQNCQAFFMRFDHANLHKALFSTGNALTGLILFKTKLDQSSLRAALAQRINAREAKFVKCDLSEGLFDQGNFSNSSLYRCVAASASFQGANFSHSNLYRAKVRKAKFIGCEFKQSNFLDADCLWADFSDSDISQCINLNPLLLKGEKNEQTLPA